MSCPPEVASVLSRILAHGLLRIRLLGGEGDAAACALEADHLHNIPALLAEFEAERLRYYWEVERPLFRERCASTAHYELLWAELKPHVSDLATV